MSETILTFNIRDSVEAHSFHINDQPSQAFRPGKKKQKKKQQFQVNTAI